MPDDLFLQPATLDDYPTLAAVVHDAFQEDKLAFGQGPSLYEEPETLLTLLEKPDRDVWKLVTHGVTIGMAVTSEKTATARWLNCLCILPAWQGMGYGSRALRLVEAAYPGAYQWRLDTPAQKSANRRFYERAGYVVVDEHVLWEGFSLLVFEKRL